MTITETTGEEDGIGEENASDSKEKQDFIEHIRHRFDPEYFNNTCINYIHRLTYLMNSSFVFDPNKTLANLSEKKAVIHVSNHVSHEDYIEQNYNLWALGAGPVRTMARSNVFVDLPFAPLGSFFEKSGGFKLPFEKMSKQQARWFAEYVEGLLVNGERILFYPEGGRSRNTNEIGEFKTGALGIFSSSARRRNLDLTIVPHYIAYDRPVEAGAYGVVDFLKKRSLTLYQMADLSRFFFRYGTGYLKSKFGVGRGVVMDVIGEPIAVREMKDDGGEGYLCAKELAKRSREAIVKIKRDYDTKLEALVANPLTDLGQIAMR